MIRYLKGNSATVFCSALAVATAAGQPVAQLSDLPASAFVGAAMYEPRISPDGSQVLFLRDADAATEIVVVDLASGRGDVAAAVRHGKSVLERCDWATNERLVCSRMWFFKNRGVDRVPRNGYEFKPNTRLFAMDRDGSNVRELVPPPKKKNTIRGLNGEMWIMPSHSPGLEGKHDVVSLLPDDPDHILVELMRGHLWSVGVWKLNIRSNALTPVVPHIIFAMDWSADEQGRVRIGTGYSDRSRSWRRRQVHVQDGAGGFRTLEAEDTPQFGAPLLAPKMLGFNADGTSAYVEAHDGETGRLAVLQIAPDTLAVQRRIVAFDQRDATSVAVRGTRCGVVGFAHQGTGTFTWLDGEFGRDVEELDRKVPGRIRAIPSMSADCSRLLAIAEGGGRTPTVYLHDRGSGKTSRLGARNPALAGRLAETRDVSFKSTDGYPLDATLTLPRQPGTGAPPLVVMLDVGPLGMAEGDSPWAQFLASRGYAVLAPRVRGMAGLGDDHLTSGLSMWGRRMRDDMAAGVSWATERGFATAGRVCYVGRAHGGYMALAGAKDGDAGVRCAAAFGFDRIKNEHFFHNDRVGRFNQYWRFWLDKHWGEGVELAKLRKGQSIWRDDHPLRGEDGESLASATVSPLLDSPHPGVPVLLDAGDRSELFEGDTRRYQKAVVALAGANHGLPQGHSRETAFLNALLTLLDREIGEGG